MTMKIFTRKSATAQKGSTLVEASVVVLIAGLMLTGVTNGQSMLETTRATKLLNDVKSIEALLGHFETAKGRLPGDCNSDGLIGAGLNSVGGLVSTVGATAYSLSPTAQTTRAQLYSFSGAATVANLAAGNDTHCPAVAGSAAAETNVNVWVNDLRANNFIGANTVPRLFAKHIGEDMIFVGSFGDAATGETYNAMTLVNVPAGMAQRLTSMAMTQQLTLVKCVSSTTRPATLMSLMPLRARPLAVLLTLCISTAISRALALNS
jgi:hypothetical protein